MRVHWIVILYFFPFQGQDLNGEDKHGTRSDLILTLFTASSFLILGGSLGAHLLSPGAVRRLTSHLPLTVSLRAGSLVKKILETKKDYELSPSSPKSKEQVRTVLAVVSLLVL